MNQVNSPNTPELAGDLAERAGERADDALLAARRATGDVANQVESGIDTLRQKIPQAISSATAQAEDLARRGVARVRDAGTAVREQATRAGDNTVAYIRDEPVKSVLIAAAAGAVATVVLTWMTQSRRD